jgi:hypothetical protein
MATAAPKFAGTPKSHANDPGFAGDSMPTAKFGGGKHQPRRRQTRHYWQIIYRTREHEVDVFVIAIDYSSERWSAQCLLYGRWRGSSIPTAVHAAAERRQRDEAKPGCLTRMSVRCSLCATCQTRQSVVQHAHRNVRAESVRPVRPARSIRRRAARPVKGLARKDVKRSSCPLFCRHSSQSR